MKLFKTEKKTILSKLAIAIVVIYYLLGIVALFAQDHGSALMKAGDMQAFQFWYNKVWHSLSQFVVLIPLLGALPNLILNIVGIIKEKRIFPFLLCIVLPVFNWFVVVAVATAHF